MTPGQFLELGEVVALLDSPNPAVQASALASLRLQGVVWTELTRELGFTLRAEPRPRKVKPRKAKSKKVPSKKIRLLAVRKIPPLADRLKERADRATVRARPHVEPGGPIPGSTSR